MTSVEMFYAQLASIAVACVMTAVSSRWRTVGRLLFVLLFLWAAEVNLRTALGRPQVYLEYAPLAYSDLYRQFILGFFSRHITPLVAAVAMAQFLIAVLVSLRGFTVQLGLIGAIVFLVAIAPLGTGSGFPSTLVMAVAAVPLLRAQYPQSLWRMTRSRLRFRGHRGSAEAVRTLAD